MLCISNVILSQKRVTTDFFAYTYIIDFDPLSGDMNIECKGDINNNDLYSKICKHRYLEEFNKYIKNIRNENPYIKKWYTIDTARKISKCYRDRSAEIENFIDNFSNRKI